MENNPSAKLVSVCMITYNHAKYIAEAIESVLTQKTSFDFELIIADDCSTDETGSICQDYQIKFPKRIRLVRREKNAGVKKNFSETLVAAAGKYIALCEGDDFWTDPNKLQKQVDFLEKNDEYVLSHHDAVTVDESGATIKESRLPANTKTVYEQSDLLKISQVITCTMVFRNIFRENPMPEEYWFAFGGDKFVAVMLGLHGKANLHRDMRGAAYRVHPGGIYSGIASEVEKLESTLSTRIAIYLFLKRQGRAERFHILTKHILPILIKIYRLKGENFRVRLFLRIVRFLK